MALSQLQCLDNHNVNWRSSETKPEFFYSEEQRLALEALVSTGEESYREVVKKENIRDFLSELEVAKIACSVEAFDPDLSLPRKNGDKPETEGEGEPQVEDTEQSLEYWPDRSDCSIPELDLGWPDTVAYRGVTRATVYMQPPIDGQPHIKEVIRKMITQAQKVIALVMDLFTDLDILKDLLDAGFKRKVSVYIILNESDVKYFLRMCEKAQMHKGHLKNLRVRTLGGPEFYTRFSTKFKGCLSQKFMFVDGDKAACGSYSFTWSAARIDRNLLTVLSGQVVETFDRQFQDLYLLSKGLSLKNVQMDNEPEPEPVIQPATVPTGPSEAMARKMHNPKYALVTVKSASEAGKDTKKESDAVKKIAIKPRAAAREPMDEPQLHPALQDMERANMFEYLPTWVEPDPEPGSEILGYINIIDPNIRNAQPSQMNRIKICDTSQATAQYMQQAKELERQKQENAEHDHNNSKPSSQSSCNKEHQHSHMANPSRQTDQDQVVSGHNTVSRQASLEQKTGPSSSKPNLSRQASHSRESQGSKDNPSRQRNQDLGYGSRQASLEQKPVSDIETTISNLISLEESLLNTEIISVEQPNDANSAGQESPDVNSLQKSVEGIAALAGNHHILSHKPPPVPKPRTVPVTDFISMKNALNANSGRIATPTEEIPAPFVNGVEERDSEQIDILIENEPASSEQDEESNLLQGSTGEYSSSGSGSLPQSNASSMSEEYYPSTSLQRRSSDRIPNGERPSLQRKLSDSHISRGSFSSPLISQTFMDARSMENGKRRNTLEEELKRVLSSSHPLQGKDRVFSLETPQEKNNFQYTSNGPPGGYDRFSSQHGARNVGKGRGQREVSMDGPSGYRQVNRKSEGLASRPGLWSAKDYGRGYTSPLSQSPVPTENASTPFGIPFSKLSQTKHLKSKLGTTGLDSRRRSHGPPGHKDL
ncbi:protein FAM83G isoform X2 [Lithobates pipiens]